MITKDVVPLLDALFPEEADYYQLESKVVELEGKSVVLAEGLADQYVFVGGTEAEYIRYFQRPLPSNMWHWGLASEVKAIAGFSVVPKKDLPETVKTSHAVRGQLLVVSLSQT